MLASFGGMLTGTYDAPIAVDVHWDPPGGESDVFTRVPINHHVPRAVFQQWFGPAYAWRVAIMLKPGSDAETRAPVGDSSQARVQIP